MGLKETDLRKILEVPQGSKLISNEEGLIVGVEIVNDGSFDYSEEGQKFLGLSLKGHSLKPNQQK